ncbi:MAG: hypothetical protein HOK50_08360 [Kordiimonadaceae bacterium]|jgi:hypothetical protein|nr:hypothetical protein [Kordiimonadaceae bacterium]MBT6032622.1 hypothetical protein [Kordiimonadaceae bacterium]MBT6467655.1 hypothetical protein [Kordiimonadaceae bacterium]
MAIENTPEQDRIEMEKYISKVPDTKSVSHFKPSADIIKLPLKFDIEKLRQAVDDISAGNEFIDIGSGFQATSLTKRPNVDVVTDNDLSGRFYTRIDDSLKEYARDEIVNESEFTDIIEGFKGTYFEYVHQELTKRYPIGRMRVLLKEVYNCNSWHRDPEPRLHIPIYTNPGSLFIVNHHCTHLPADGSVYFTDTRGYHTALNGGESNRVHIVAALAYPEAVIL